MLHHVSDIVSIYSRSGRRLRVEDDDGAYCPQVILLRDFAEISRFSMKIFIFFTPWNARISGRQNSSTIKSFIECDVLLDSVGCFIEVIRWTLEE